MKKIAVVFGKEYSSSDKTIQEFEKAINLRIEELEKKKYHIIKIEFTQIDEGRTAYIYYNTEKISFRLPDFGDFDFPNPFTPTPGENKDEPSFFKPNKTKGVSPFKKTD